MEPASARVTIPSLLLAELGAEGYEGLWTGQTDWNSPEVTATLEMFGEILEHTKTGAGYYETAMLFATDNAAFYIMGDWIATYFSGPTEDGNLGLTFRTDYSWVVVPGTQGLFLFSHDSFCLSANTPHPGAARAWMITMGSRQAQEELTQARGTICARTDCDPALFGEYQQAAMYDWSHNRVVMHAAVSVDQQPWGIAFMAAAAQFLEDRDAAAFQSAMAEACRAYGPCQ
jgi:glucose/mannose transport system substrate-binding protein